MSSIDAFGFVCAVQFKVHLQKNPHAVSGSNQDIKAGHDPDWFHCYLNNCWNPSNQASLQNWNWKASPQQVCLVWITGAAVVGQPGSSFVTVSLVGVKFLILIK